MQLDTRGYDRGYKLYQDLLNMGFTPLDQTRETILNEFEKLHNGVGDRILQEFLELKGCVVLISKYNEVYIYRKDRE